jgi:hypothetical protein
MSNKDVLEFEVRRAEEYKHSWENHVKPFFDSKEQELVRAFKACSSSDPAQLQLIKLQFNVLEGMKIHFQTFIETGRMAEHQLSLLEGNNNG